MKVLVQIPLSPFSGYGNDGIGLTQALIRRGLDVYLDPRAVQSPLPAEVAGLLTKTLEAPFDLVIQHVDPGQLVATPELKRAAEIVVGWTMWEYSNLRNLKGRSKLRSKLKNFDALVGYDTVSSDGLREYFSGPVLTQQGGYNPELWPRIERDWNEENFYFCMVGMLHSRKDPFVAIDAFNQLVDEHEDFAAHARLSLKTMAPGLHSAMEQVYPGLRIYYDNWPEDKLRRFYASQHVLLAPSRGEGKNMPALEFMSTGGAVVATNWGGHQQWLSESYAFPLDYTLAPVDEDTPGTLNARASVEDLKRIMLHLFRNREVGKARGEVASQIIPQTHSWDAVVERLMHKIRTEVPGGEALWMKDTIARTEASHDHP